MAGINKLSVILKTDESRLMNWMKKYWTEIAIVICSLISIFSISLYFINFSSNTLSCDRGHWGTFGDYVGGVLGTILSFFSVILIYATYKNQVSGFTLQQFESTFFTLLQIQRDLLKSLNGEFITFGQGNNFTSLTTTSEISDAFISAMAKQISERMELIDLDSLKTPEEHKNVINAIYDENYSGRKAELGHYFRHLYHIFKYAHESKILDKKKYIDIIQAQMSDDELYIAFYNGLSQYGNVRFFPLLDEYEFFENLGSRGKVFDTHAKLFYKKTKFKFLSK